MNATLTSDPKWALSIERPAVVAWIAATAACAGILSQFTLPLGSLPVAELLLAALMALLTAHLCITQRLPAGLRQSRLLWLVLAAQAVALFGYVVSDLYRDSSHGDMARGWSRMLLLAMDTVCFAFLFTESSGSLPLAQIGAALGGVAAAVAQGESLGDSWKFGYAWPVTIMAVLCVPALGFWALELALIALTGVHWVYDCRSLAGICAAMAALLLVKRVPRHFRIALLSLMLVCALGAAAFRLTRRSGAGDERAERSNVERTAMLTVAWDAFRDSPWIGQGSWFSKSKVHGEFLDLRSESARIAHVHGYSAEDTEDTIAIHSQVLVSVAEGGILGGAFFFLFGGLLAWAIRYAVFQKPSAKLDALYLLILLGGVWNLCMSPFSGGHRINIAIAIGTILLLRREYTHERLASFRNRSHAPPG